MLWLVVQYGGFLAVFVDNYHAILRVLLAWWLRNVEERCKTVPWPEEASHSARQCLWTEVSGVKEKEDNKGVFFKALKIVFLVETHNRAQYSLGTSWEVSERQGAREGGEKGRCERHTIGEQPSTSAIAQGGQQHI